MPNSVRRRLLWRASWKPSSGGAASGARSFPPCRICWPRTPASVEMLEFLAELFNASNRESDYSQALIKLFDLYCAKRNFQKATECLDRATELDPYEHGHQKRLETLRGKIDEQRFKIIAARRFHGEKGRTGGQDHRAHARRRSPAGSDVAGRNPRAVRHARQSHRASAANSGIVPWRRRAKSESAAPLFRCRARGSAREALASSCSRSARLSILLHPHLRPLQPCRRRNSDFSA